MVIMNRPQIRRMDLNRTGSILLFRTVLPASASIAVHSTVSAGSRGLTSGLLHKGARNRSDIVPDHLDVARSLAILRCQAIRIKRSADGRSQSRRQSGASVWGR